MLATYCMLEDTWSPQDNDAQSLHGVLCSMLQDWKISDKVFCWTTDNGQNIVNATQLLGIEHFPCIAHTLQLAIMKALQVPKVHSTIARCKKLVEHFKKSSKETYKLREKQMMLQLPRHQLIQECPTHRDIKLQTHDMEFSYIVAALIWCIRECSQCKERYYGYMTLLCTTVITAYLRLHF